MIIVGGARYVPGQSIDSDVPRLGEGTPVYDPFTGGSRYQPSNTGASPNTDSVNGSNQYLPATSNVHYPVVRIM